MSVARPDHPWYRRHQVLACPVCGVGRDGTASVYLITAILMCIVPLVMFGGMAYYLLRRSEACATPASRASILNISSARPVWKQHGGKALQADHCPRSPAITRSSAQHKPHRNRHPHGDRLPTPASRLEAPASHGLDRRCIEIRMSSRLLNLDLFHSSLLSDIGLDDDRAFDTPTPG